MFSALTRGCVRVFDRYLPDPLILVLIITLIVFAAGMIFQGHGPVAMLGFWQDGFWNLLSFAMQMALMLVTGFTVAKTPLFMNLVSRIATVARTPIRAVIMVAFVSLIVTWFNWGIGLVVGAILAREMARRVDGVDYRLLVASAYAGFIIWHAGLSAAAPLVVATPGHFLEEQIGIVATGETIFSPLNLIICLVVLVLMPLVCSLMMRGIKDPVTVKAEQLADESASATAADEETRPAERLEQSKWLAWISAALGFAAVITYAVGGGGLNLNIVIFVLIFLGLALHGSPKRYLETLDEAVRGVAGVLIQFPFYAGIMGMMKASGLAALMASGFVSISSAHTLPLVSFLSAGFINIFIPSGGGQWAVQGPILMEAAQSLNADIGDVITGFAWGDAWTNMIQPFWALPALAIAGLKARDIMGFCVVIMLVTGVAIGGLLLI